MYGVGSHASIDVLWLKTMIRSNLLPFGGPIRKTILHASYLPYHHPDEWNRLSQLEASHRWRFTDLAGWGIAAVSPDNFVRTLCGPVACEPRQSAFVGACSCTKNIAELTGFAESPQMDPFSSFVVFKCVSSLILSTLRVLPLKSLMPGESLPWPTDVTTFF